MKTYLLVYKTKGERVSALTFRYRIYRKTQFELSIKILDLSKCLF